MPADSTRLSAPSSDKTATPLTRIFSSVTLSNASCIIVANLAILLLIRLLTFQMAIPLDWWMQMALAIGMLFSSAFVGTHLYLHWNKPLADSRDMLQKVRNGKMTIDQLSSIQGGIRPLIVDLQEILRELRQQKAELARIELELHQRVANRTNALERSLGAVRQQAARDVLTGLLNRRTLEELLPETLNRCRAELMPLSIMMIDVDDFKLLNDTLGHTAGDSFLRSLGQLIRSTLRETDLAFRYGGDEFVILLPHNNLAHATAVGDRLMSLVNALTAPMRTARPPRLSIGLLTSEDLPTDAAPEALLDEADKLLYRVKQARKSKRPSAVVPALANL